MRFGARVGRAKVRGELATYDVRTSLGMLDARVQENLLDGCSCRRSVPLVNRSLAMVTEVMTALNAQLCLHCAVGQEEAVTIIVRLIGP